MFRMDLDRGDALFERQTSIDFTGVAPKSTASFLVRFMDMAMGRWPRSPAP
jgi:hypothetical protein